MFHNKNTGKALPPENPNSEGMAKLEQWKKAALCFQKGLLHANRFPPKLSFVCICDDSVLGDLICMDHTY